MGGGWDLVLCCWFFSGQGFSSFLNCSLFRLFHELFHFVVSTFLVLWILVLNLEKN